MPRESAAAFLSRVADICRALPRVYPGAHCELDFKTPLELLIATILSAQCTDKRVNIVTKELFHVCKTAADFVALPIERLEELVKTTGFYRTKAKNIKSCCTTLVARHDGEVPHTMDELTQLAGVGRKTANVVLGNAYGMNIGVVVDTHVSRLSQRLGLSKATTPEKIEADLMRLIAREYWALFSHWLIWHGRRRCSARKPDCFECELAVLCPSASNAVK